MDWDNKSVYHVLREGLRPFYYTLFFITDVTKRNCALQYHIIYNCIRVSWCIINVIRHLIYFFYTRTRIDWPEIKSWNKALIYRRSVNGRYMIEYLEPPLGFELKRFLRIYEEHNDFINLWMQLLLILSVLS